MRNPTEKLYDHLYFSTVRNCMTPVRSLLLMLPCAILLLLNPAGLLQTALWLMLLLTVLSLLPDLIGYRTSMLTLIPAGGDHWRMRMALLPFLRARYMARLDNNFVELEVFTLLRFAYINHLNGTITLASYLFANQKIRASHATAINHYFIGWHATEQENLGHVTLLQASLLNRLIKTRSRDDGKKRSLVKPGPIHGIVIRCAPPPPPVVPDH